MAELYGVASIWKHEEKSNAISSAYRSVHPSHLGRVDIDSSSNSDPGVSGTICPLAKLYDNHFTEYEEPSEWRERVHMVLDQYRAMKSKKSLYKLVKDIKEEPEDEQASAVRQDCLEAAWDILQSPLRLMMPEMSEPTSQAIDIFGDGHFIIEETDE